MLPTQPYNAGEVYSLIESTEDAATRIARLTEIVQQYFYRTNLEHYFYNVTEKRFVLVTLKQIREQFFTPSHKIIVYNTALDRRETWKLFDYYNVKYTKRYTKINDPFQPVLTETTINMGARYSIDTVDPTQNTAEEQELASRYHAHVHEVLCSGDQTMSDYLMRWLAYTVMGKKLQTMVWLKGAMGVGKSSITTDFLPRIMSQELCVSVQEPSMFLSRFNSLLDGAKLMIIEELPTNKWEWVLVEKCLRNIITSRYIKIESKGINAVNSKNSVNILMNSNEAVMRLTEQDRRIVMPQISNEIRSKEYYDTLQDVLTRNDMPLIMFRYFKQIHDENPDFITSHTTIPKSESRAEAMRQGLTSVHNWLKYELLQKIDVNMTIKDLVKRYETWFSKEKLPGQPQDKSAVNRLLTSLNIVARATRVNNIAGRYFALNHQQLFDFFSKKNWLDEDDVLEYSNTDAIDFSDLGSA